VVGVRGCDVDYVDVGIFDEVGVGAVGGAMGVLLFWGDVFGDEFLCAFEGGG